MTGIFLRSQQTPLHFRETDCMVSSIKKKRSGELKQKQTKMFDGINIKSGYITMTCPQYLLDDLTISLYEKI